MYFYEFLRPFILKVPLAGKIVENTVNERWILVKIKEKICRSAWVKLAQLPSVKKLAFSIMFPAMSYVRHIFIKNNPPFSSFL